VYIRTAILGLLMLLARGVAAQPVAPAVVEEGRVVDVATAEAVVVETPNGAQPAVAQVSKPPGQPGKSPGQPGNQPGQPGQPPKGGKPGESGEKKEGESGEKKEESSAAVKRPDKPPRVPDPREFDVKLDDQGRVPPFNFIGQAWPDVLQWVANVSKCSLDWQELPSDYLNLTTQRPYSLDEVRDLVNRHLNARGYTSIQSGEVLSVFKIDKLDPSLVRRVAEDELYDLKPYDFVKVSFELPAGMDVEKAKDDVKQLLSPTAKIFPLVSSKRLLVMDSVANLRTVSELLNQERMVEDGRIVPKEIVLKHARPQKVIEILYVILGIDPKAKPAQTDPQAQQQLMQQMQQMQQQGRNVAKLMPKEDVPKVYLAYNRHRNSVLVNAPPEQLKIIERTITYLDVPFGTATDAAVLGATGSDERTMKKYPLTTLDPDQFVATLEEIGGLSPMAEFKADEDSRVLFAMATAADHARISGLLDQFDGSGRQFEVVWLRKHPADAVAATINTLMASQTQREDRNRYYDPWDYDWREREERRRRQQVKGFGVDADIERNRLLLWANEAEMKRVRDLLVKLGELPGGPTNMRPVRVIAPADAKDTAALLEKLRAAWPAAGGNPLIIKGPSAKPAAPTAKPDDDKKPAATEPAASTSAAMGDRSAEAAPPSRVAARFAQLDAAAASPAGGNGVAAAPESVIEPQSKPTDFVEDPTSPAPVTVTVTEDGRLMLSSSDPAALDRLEELIEELAPPQRRFHVFPCRHIRAAEMWYDLTDFFKEDLEGGDKSYIRDWNGFMVPMNNQKESGSGLAKRRKLMITYDRPSNSILVANANATQLAEIQQLIEQFDKPSGTDSVEVRQTAAIKIQYSRPSIIAAAVKEVYRELLSKRDKEFERGDKREEKSATEHMTVINYGGSGDGNGSGRPTPVRIGFDGALSLGADDVSGVLIVSAQKAIFDDIVRMVRELDNEAAPKTTVHVHHVNGNVSAKAIQQALDKAVGKAWLGNRPEQQPAQTGQEGDKKGQKNRNNNRGDQQNNNNSGNEGNNNEGQ
jgi:type II secretory pathway component GspD/PulD (secretin)